MFLFRRAVEVFILTNLALGLIQQWMIPAVVHSLNPFSKMQVFKAIERLLKLAIPNHLIWLVWFYLIFHSFLNTVGEVRDICIGRSINIVQYLSRNLP